MPKKDSIIPLSGLFPLRDMDGWIPLSSKNGSLSTVVGDEKLTSREDRIGPFFMYVQCDEDTLLKVDKVLKPKPKRLMSLINLLVASSFAFE